MTAILAGYCQCGCGKETPLAVHTNRREGRIKGQPTRFVRGHYDRPKGFGKGRDLEKLRRWKAANRGHINAREARYQRERRARDPEYAERMREASRARYRENRQEYIERASRWREENPEHARECARRAARSDHRRQARRDGEALRRARKRAGFVERVDSLVVLERDDGACGICGEDVDPVNFEIDHIVPLAKGGFHNYENAQPAHAFCNRSKGASHHR